MPGVSLACGNPIREGLVQQLCKADDSTALLIVRPMLKLGICAVYCSKLSISPSLREYKTAYEICFDTRPTMPYVSIFRKKAIDLNKRLKEKFHPRSHEHIFVSCSTETKV
ncbi:hypothetical protein CEXT_466831 [Caerostris extrusa]|uniref:Uncharacterized protein n=1 Tax=Caerostris extrusa TaxID=172846 RepID=A0AAV4W0L4_CAEEX|nr:hypothetical protein CEXT_466831 [Caerostris extrusa]